MPQPPPILLLDRYVRFKDELLSVIEESGQPSLDLVIESVVGRLPDSSSTEERDEAIDVEYTRYMEEVIEPAFAILRERRASCPGDVRKVPIACTNVYDLAYYRELLDGIEPCLSPLDGAPSVTSLTLRISWRPNHPIRSYPLSAIIAGSDDVFLALYYGTCRPCSLEPGFYLVFNTFANSISIVPPLPSSGFHCPIGAELAILALDIKKLPHTSFYVLAELLFRLKSRRDLPSNKGTLFLWWSPGSRSAPLATGRWIQIEVVLPIPADEGTTPTYSFHADMIIPVVGRSILWVDLLKGILLCDLIDYHGDGDATFDVPLFYFIPLPDGCAIQPDGRTGRGQPDEYRSMCSVTSEVFRFVSMEAYSEGCPMGKVLFRTWLLHLSRDRTWTWRMEMKSLVDIWNDPIYKNDLKLQPLTPMYPIISCALGEYMKTYDTIYLVLNDFKLEHGWTVANGFYVFGLDIRHGNITSAIKLPCDEDGDVVSAIKIFASHFNYFLYETSILQSRMLELTDLSIMGKEVAHEGEGKFDKWTLCEEEDPLRTYTLGTHRITLGTQRSIFHEWFLCGEDEPSVPGIGAHFAQLKFCQDGFGGRRIISSSSKNEPSASMGLHCVLS